MKYLISTSLILLMTSSTVGLGQSRPDVKTFVSKQPCADWETMLSTPAKYKEEMLFTGNGLQFSASNGQPYTGGMFFFTNQDTGSWTMLSVYADGMACMIANGKDFAPYVGKQPEFFKEEKDGL